MEGTAIYIYISTIYISIYVCVCGVYLNFLYIACLQTLIITIGLSFQNGAKRFSIYCAIFSW